MSYIYRVQVQPTTQETQLRNEFFTLVINECRNDTITVTVYRGIKSAGTAGANFGDVSAKLRNKEWMLIKNVLFWHNLLKDNTKDHLTFPQIDYQPLTADQLMLVCCL